jgi:uncharacterized cupredoxin-like copper-binding protein
MNRRLLFVSIATIALAAGAVACTSEPDDSLAGPDPAGQPVATAAANPTVPANPSAPADGAATGSSAAVQELTVVTRDAMRFDPSGLTVVAGRPVRLTVRNDGGSTHDFTLTEGVAQAVKITVKGGQSSSATFTIDRPGSYPFVCSVPGHAMVGMRGTITATAA